MLIESKLSAKKCCQDDRAAKELTYVVIENEPRRPKRVAVSIVIDGDGTDCPLRVYVDGRDLIRAVKNAMNHKGGKP